MGSLPDTKNAQKILKVAQTCGHEQEGSFIEFILPYEVGRREREPAEERAKRAQPEAQVTQIL